MLWRRICYPGSVLSSNFNSVSYSQVSICEGHFLFQRQGCVHHMSTHQSLYISSNYYRLAHTGMHQFASVHISAHYCTLVHIGAHQYQYISVYGSVHFGSESGSCGSGLQRGSVRIGSVRRPVRAVRFGRFGLDARFGSVRRRTVRFGRFGLFDRFGAVRFLS